MMGTENYSLLKKRILEEILKDRSTSELSRELGFGIDQYKRWLNDEKIFRWNDFEFLCEKKGIKLENALSLIIPSYVYNKDRSVFSFLKEWSTDLSNAELAKYLGCHISVVKRHNQGKTTPDLETILKILDLKNNQLSNFVKELFRYDISQGPLNDWIVGDHDFHGDVLKYPYIGVIESLVGIESYKYKDMPSDLWIAKKLSLPLDQVRFLLKKMLNMEILEYDFQKDVYRSLKKVTNLEGLTFQDHIPCFEFYNQKFLEHVARRKDPNYVDSAFAAAKTYIVFEMNEETMKKVNEIILKAQNEIITLANNNKEGATEVRGVTLQTFSLAK